MYLNPASQNFIIPIFPSSKLLLTKSSREMTRIAKFAKGKKICNWYNQVPAELLWKLLQVCFLFLNPRKLIIVLCKFSREKTNFTDWQNVHDFSIFVNKLSNCTVFDKRKRENSEEKGKKCKTKFRRTCIVPMPLYAIDEAGKINRLPRWV